MIKIVDIILHKNKPSNNYYKYELGNKNYMVNTIVSRW